MVLTDLAAGIIRSTLGSLGSSMSCELCKKALDERVKEVVRLWMMTKVIPIPVDLLIVRFGVIDSLNSYL